MTLDEFNRLHPHAAVTELLTCCASRGWAQQVSHGRPYRSTDALLAAGDTAFAALSAGDVDTAVAAHPRIGDRPAATDRASTWSRQEQAGVATTDVRAELAAANVAYEERFGHVFLICATGRSAAEILTEARRRLANDAHTERAETVRELGAIVRLRLRKLVTQ